MNIIWDKSIKEKLEKNYTILELETFEQNGKEITAYCVVDQVSVAELPSLDVSRQLHNSFIQEYKKANYKFCIEAVQHLRGKFNGELDSFYDTIIDRIEN